MAEPSHLLKPEGWRMLFRKSENQVCAELLPDPGTTILIAQSRTGKGCSAMWIDRKGMLKTVAILPVEDHWEAKAKYNGQSYVITVAVNPGVNGRPTIGGLVKVRPSKASSIRKPPGGWEAEGTWGAEANPSGGPGTKTA